MNVITLLQRNVKWRFHNKFTVVITILQPMLWLVLYSAVASQAMSGIGIRNYTTFILPGLIVLVSFGSCSSSGIMNYLMKADGSFYRILIAPISRKSIVLGQVLEAVLCTFIEVGIMCIASLFFSVKIQTNLSGILIIILIIFLNAMSLSSLTYAISLVLPNEVVYETAMNAIVLPVFFLSTALFPENTLTGWLKVAVNLNPFTHVINLLRTLMIEGRVEILQLIIVIAMLIVIGGITFLLALFRLKKETSL
ncbi:ABC-2 type transport system permease protein [Clostridium saccharoperbutylacetonicum]|uniref:Transport permease protein n=1 Tax=Clostridium saccharoperbutylacetonicum N1-4(HMT) TaxID=931276 RepID=M1MM44_9CLOT|nr:ABC transporter permease [Clostridium saccharoperbutylacetonicum]AGF55831.1 ABC-type polysaccharide/polyol phosphate export system, permease component [Clostridium saccharoperbutylacetonicum N1-4(HMT)]NRT63435.1 ABC-2 type transport system permease protein [Clostridium saccharoperbutylacetonicum]NSB26797.1 ABC-2 type transport system permease protein [Clostridium saccharoperbutylacetonicum]NSB40276.1 ABC-2 type transport system permease protein [Clostridium saccharoperbutylacetonicum]